ncbi:MAG: AarF/ABC1/UbiB kinase family protein [Rhodospirillaceae bacterium]
MGGRVRRYAKVGGTFGGLAARVAGNRLFGIELDRGAHASELKAALGGLKGPLMKVAQILATVPDVLPKEYIEELRQLQANAPPMGWAFVRRRMAAELGPDWQNNFKSFERDAASAASLGQVHRAEGLEGERLACKVQYPDMASAVEADLKQLKLIFSLYRQYDRAIDPSQIHLELSERLREELDYEREAANMALYRGMLVDEAGVHMPDVWDDLSTDRLLTMSWLDGAPLMDQVGGDLEFRNKIAFNMFRAWYVPFYYYGVIHGDPHLGNYSVRPDGSINLLDFGCIRIFSPDFVRAVIDLYMALRDEDDDLAVAAYETWGFTDLSKEMISVLNQWARFLYGPLLKDKVQTIQENGGVMYGAGVAANVHMELKRLGGVTPPREFVLVDRAAIGLGSVFTHLNAEINWHRLFHELIDDFDVKKLEKRQKEALDRAGVLLAY